MEKNVKKKALLKWSALPLVAVVGYLLALQIWSWRWDTPSQPLPEGHLSHEDVATGTGSSPDLAALAQSGLVAMANDLQSVSVSGAMSINGEPVWSGTVGLASIVPYVPATVNTQYRIGSVSKAITAVALMRMVEEGKLELDVPIHQYLPSFPKHNAPITARQLASHTAGIRHYHFEPFKFPPTDGLSNHQYGDVEEALSQFSDDALLFEPGHDFAYSTHGYTLLSAVMQAAGNMKFDLLLEELINAPLGLNKTVAEHLIPSTAELARFYVADNGKFGLTPEQNLSNKVAGGGLVSTPSELVQIGSALMNNGLLSESSFSTMTQVQKIAGGEDNPQSYALGWRHYTTRHILDGEDVDVIHHGGVSVGANAFLLLVPQYNISVAILTNSKGQNSRGEIQMFAYRLAGQAIAAKQLDANGEAVMSAE